MEEYATLRNVITGITRRYCKFFPRPSQTQYHNKVEEEGLAFAL